MMTCRCLVTTAWRSSIQFDNLLQLVATIETSANFENCVSKKAPVETAGPFLPYTLTLELGAQLVVSAQVPRTDSFCCFMIRVHSYCSNDTARNLC